MIILVPVGLLSVALVCSSEHPHLKSRMSPTRTPLRMWHVAMDAPVVCKGITYLVFESREDAEKAIDELNCYDFDGHSLRVDWFYPSA